MSKLILPAMLVVSLSLDATLMATAHAQTSGAPVMATPSQPMPNYPAFRDPKTGQVWTPENVGGKGGEVSPQDRAFNPSGQTVNSGQVVEEMAPVQKVGTVAITAGPTVPLVALDNVSLQVQPGGRWQAVLYLQNNSGGPQTPVLGCAFTNGGNMVQDTRVSLPAIPGGDRVGLVVTGPGSAVYVDSVSCNVVSP